MPFITDLISKITNFRVKIGDKLNTLKSQIGQLNLLTTNDKTSLVGAVNEVNNIQIGGRNLYKGTKDFSGDDWSTYGWNKELETYKGLTIFSRQYDWLGVSQSLTLELGLYTYSCYVKITSIDKKILLIGTENEVGDAKGNIVNSNLSEFNSKPLNTWFRIKFTVEITQPGKNRIRIEGYNDNSSKLYICGLKLEKGNKATDWTPAPEDQVSDWAETNSDSLSFIKGKEIVNNEFNNVYNQISLRANNRLSNLASDLTAREKGTIRDKIGVVLQTVNDGELTLTTGTGLNGSANFTANQAGGSTFSVDVASTHKLPSTAEWVDTLKKNEENVVTSNFEITDGSATMRVGVYGAISGEVEGISKIDLGSEDGYAVYYRMDNGRSFSAYVDGISGNSNYYWYLGTNSVGDSRMSMPMTGTTERVLTTGAKIGTTTYYANTQGVIELPEYTTYTAGNGLTLSGTTFSLPVVTSGSGNVVSSVTQTANGISVSKDISAMTTSHVANSIDQNLSKSSNPTFNSIELSAPIPYIDFHFGNSTADYTSRITENSLGGLNLISKDSLKYNVDGSADPFLDIDRYKAVLGSSSNDFEAVTLKTLFGSVIFDDGGLQSSSHVIAPAYYESSLRRFKTNIKSFTKSGLDIINSLKIVTFDRNDSNIKNKVGIIADDSPSEVLSETRNEVDLYKTIFVQAKAIQELDSKNKTLEERISQLEEIIKNML